MEITTCLEILTAVSLIAPFVIEALKKLLESRTYNVNVLSAITAAVIAFAACAAYMVVSKTYLTPASVTYAIGTVFFSVLGALCGYDKIYKLVFDMFKKKGE
jgi:peptidoglycan/LPS O-acetylase OafA/YrhL